MRGVPLEGLLYAEAIITTPTGTPTAIAGRAARDVHLPSMK